MLDFIDIYLCQAYPLKVDILTYTHLRTLVYIYQFKDIGFYHFFCMRVQSSLWLAGYFAFFSKCNICMQIKGLMSFIAFKVQIIVILCLLRIVNSLSSQKEIATKQVCLSLDKHTLSLLVSASILDLVLPLHFHYQKFDFLR